jgi:hypothetical protein
MMWRGRWEQSHSISHRLHHLQAHVKVVAVKKLTVGSQTRARLGTLVLAAGAGGQK